MNNKKIEILSEVISSIPKGQIVSVSWKRKAKTLKKCSSIIEKIIDGRVRVGIQNDNVQNVKECRESGELPVKSTQISWGHYPEGLYPYIFEHNKTHKRYACFYFIPGKKDKKEYIETKWIKDGQQTTMEEIANLLHSSEKRNKMNKAENTFKVSLEDISKIKSKDIQWSE